jgi:hypothetical protein
MYVCVFVWVYMSIYLCVRYVRMHVYRPVGVGLRSQAYIYLTYVSIDCTEW